MRKSKLNPRARSFRPKGRANESKQDSTSNQSVVGALGRGFPGLPMRMRRKLTYFEPIVLATSGAGPSVAGAYVFSANGLFDPNITAAGHQPLGFDQWMAMYNHYTVHSCRITIVCTANAAGPVYVALSRSADSTVTTDAVKLVENGNISYQQLPINTIESVFFKQSMTINMAKFEGVDDVLDDSDLRGTISANPVEQAYFHLSTWNPFTAAALSAYFSVLLEYDATFTEPKLLPIS